MFGHFFCKVSARFQKKKMKKKKKSMKFSNTKNAQKKRSRDAGKNKKKNAHSGVYAQKNGSIMKNRYKKAKNAQKRSKRFFFKKSSNALQCAQKSTNKAPKKPPKAQKTHKKPQKSSKNAQKNAPSGPDCGVTASPVMFMNPSQVLHTWSSSHTQTGSGSMSSTTRLKTCEKARENDEK
jgi:hypothetical protein